MPMERTFISVRFQRLRSYPKAVIEFNKLCRVRLRVSVVRAVRASTFDVTVNPQKRQWTLPLSIFLKICFEEMSVNHV